MVTILLLIAVTMVMYDILYQNIRLLSSEYKLQIKNPAIQMARVAGKLRVISLWIENKETSKP